MRKLLIFIAVLLAALPLVARAAPDPGLVAERCDLVKSVLTQQRKRDLVSRINRGRAYQNAITQQQALISRMRNNQLNADSYASQASGIQAGVDRFRNAYTQYDDAMGALLQIDCAQKPNDFINQLEKVRTLRGAVGEQVTATETAMNEFREHVVTLQSEIDRLRNSVLGERL